MTFSFTKDERDAVIYAISNQIENLDAARSLTDTAQVSMLFQREVDRLKDALVKLDARNA